MATSSTTKAEFLRSEKAVVLRDELQKMVDDPQYNTQLRYSQINLSDTGFIKKHMEYMSNHLRMDHGQYILNLKLMTKLQDTYR